MAEQRVAHWLRPNAAARIPRRVVCFDSEAYSTYDGATQEQTFRLASASFDQLDADGLQLKPTLWTHTESPQALWSWIVERCVTQHRTVCFAHNLSYDLRLTQALELLPELGFDCRQIALSDYSCWAFYRRGQQSLYLVDSLSFLPRSLDGIAGLLNLPRVKLPDDEAPTEAWQERCRGDVEVLRAAVLRLVRLLRAHDLGDFRTTGAAQGSAAFRHRFMAPKSLLVHDSAAALTAERQAAFCGRAEVWKHGRYDEPLYEYDLSAAYARIGRDFELPVRLIGEFFPETAAQWDELRERYCLLTECAVETEREAVPAMNGERIVWPVGTFTTALWDCELLLVEGEGAAVVAKRVFAYERKPLLHDWAVWILAALDGAAPGDDPIGQLLCKEWSRSLIGRFGMRYSALERLGEAPFSDVSLYPVRDETEGRDCEYLHLGRQLYERGAKQESPNSTPAVMGYVMALCRVRLWETMLRAGLDNVYSVDTDGLIVNAAGQANLLRRRALNERIGLRLKGSYRSAELRGPKNMDLDQSRRVSGVPRKAAKLAPGRFRGEVWESLPSALRRRRTDRLVVSERDFMVGTKDPRREHLADGRTAPLRLG